MVCKCASPAYTTSVPREAIAQAIAEEITPLI